MDNLEHQIQQFWEERTSPEQRREILRQLEESGMEWREFMLANYGAVLCGEKPGELSSEQKSRVWERLQSHTLGERVGGKDRAGISDGARLDGRSGKEIGKRGVGYEADESVGADDGEKTRIVGLGWRSGWLPWMAAACVLLVVAVWLSQLGKKGIESEEVAVQHSVEPRMILRKNVSAAEDSLLLPDHSVVLLAPGSSVRYQQGFEANARHIQLEGKALFDVAKDSLRPFTVTAHGYATTALATRFVVDATKPEVSIRLINGKIVVNSAADAVVALQKVYLMPGQELKISNTKKHFILKSAVSRADEENNLALSFERTSLNNVFQRLGDYYHIPIRYDKAEVQGLSFTGNFKSGDGLELALKVICNVNQLSFVKENGRIVVSKQQ